MKKTILTFALLILTFSTNFAHNENNGNKNSKDSVESNLETTFNMNHFENDHKLQVEIKGNIDNTASISITNQRGSAILFSLVEGKNEEIEFDLTKLEKGTYNVMYLTNQEIRIKKLIID